MYNSNKAFLNRNKLQNINQLHGVFVWGKTQLQILKKNYGNLDNLYLTGSPRIDLLRYPYNRIFDKSRKLIKRKYGKFILITTNFSTANIDKWYKKNLFSD